MKKASSLRKALPWLLCSMMLLSVLPMTAFAANSYDETVDDYYTFAADGKMILSK